METKQADGMAQVGSMQGNEIILYQPDDTLTLDVRVEEETVWLTQAQMAELFQATKQNISLHIKNIYKERELEEIATVKEYLTVQKEGRRKIIDEDVYHIGASLKDLGKKLFTFSKMEVMTGSQLIGVL